MLLRILHMPRIYGEIPTDPEHGPMYCSAMLEMLKEATINCVLCVDSEHALYETIDRNISDKKRWPEMHRKRAQQYMKWLKQHKRLIAIEVEPGPDRGCGATGCEQAMAIALQERPKLVVGLERCEQCTSLKSQEVGMIGRGEYAASSFSHTRQGVERVELSAHQWDKTKFEREVWQPIFQYARYVKIYDRMVGRHIKRSEHKDQIDIGDNFKSGLEWVFQQFVALSPKQDDRLFEVYCGLADKDLSLQRIAADRLRTFARDMSEKYGLRMDMIIKREHFASTMPHARYLFTDQVALLVERGFDLIGDDDRVRDVIISHVSNRGKVESDVARLPAVK